MVDRNAIRESFINPRFNELDAGDDHAGHTSEGI